MSQTYTHTCPCGKQYTDNDPDVYFCESCVAERKKIAAEVDKKRDSLPKKQRVSDLQIALEKGQVRGQGIFVRASDLGIRF